MAEARLLFELATPNRLVVSEEVDEVVAPGVEGYFGVLPGHAPFLTALKPGEVVYRTGRNERYLACGSGFVEVRGDRVIILSETAERPEEIELSRAERAKRRAEERLAGKSREEIDCVRALIALDRALVRIQVAGRK